MNIENILNTLSGVRRSHGGFIARCPAHDDNKQSLAVSQTADRILLNCFAGCTTEKILSTLGLEWKQMFQGKPRTPSAPLAGKGVRYFGSPSAKTAAVYRYTDENGGLIYENVRFEPKDFRQRHFDPDGKPVWNLQGIEPSMRRPAAQRGVSGCL